MTEVTPGIFQLKIPLPEKSVLLGYVNTYLVQGKDGYLLVDTGWSTDEAFASLQDQMAEIRLGPGDISQVVSTHIHPDHYGLAGRLKQVSGAKIALHYLDRDLIDSRYVHMDSLLDQLAQWLDANGVPDNILPDLQKASLSLVKFVTPVMPDLTLYGGETLSTGSFSFKVLWTPGHSPGHICLYEPERRILISGDHILPTITPNVGLHPQSNHNPLGDYLNSLNLVKQLEVALVLPGHENPFHDLGMRVKKLIEHHERRNAEILRIATAKPKTAYQVATEMTWVPDRRGITFQDLSPLDQRLAILETAAHLELIHVGGQIKKSTRDGIIFYQAAN